MASKIYYFSGTAHWAKLHKPDAKYKNYTIDLHMDEGELARYEKSGASGEIRDDEGLKTKYVRFRRPHSKIIKDEAVIFGPPEVLASDNTEWTGGPLGNGSKVTVKVTVFDTIKGKGCRLDGVRVEEFEPYANMDVGDTVSPF